MRFGGIALTYITEPNSPLSPHTHPHTHTHFVFLWGPEGGVAVCDEGPGGVGGGIYRRPTLEAHTTLRAHRSRGGRRKIIPDPAPIRFPRSERLGTLRGAGAPER